MGRNTWVHETNSRNLSVQLSLTQVAKMLCLSYYASVFSSTKSVTRAEWDLPETEEGRGEGWGRGAGGEMTPIMNAHVNK
jgi:hypothetical protein